MSEVTRDLSHTEPLKFLKRARETGGECVRFEYTLHPSFDAAPSDSDLSHRRWLIDVEDDHLHPKQEEVFTVRTGTLRVAVEGTGRTLTEGEEVTLPAGVQHRHGNPTDQPARVTHEVRPALQAEPIIEALFEAAQAGHAHEDGSPNPLHFAVIQDQYPGHAYRAGLPIPIQKALFTLLALIGRLAGYEALPPVEAPESAR